MMIPCFLRNAPCRRSAHLLLQSPRPPEPLPVVCPVNPVICDFGLAKMIKDTSVNGSSKQLKEDGSSLLNGSAVKGMREANAVGISYRYAAPEAFNRMYQKKSNEVEAKPVGTYLLDSNSHYFSDYATYTPTSPR